MNIEISIREHFEKNLSCIKNLTKEYDKIQTIVKELICARDNGNLIFVMGNGGSGSTSSHFVSDLLKTAITEESNRFKAVSLVDNIPVNLAWSNDVSYDKIFSEQLTNFLSKDDVVICFSGSGNSLNLINAINHAKTVGAKTIAISGMGGGHIAKLAALSLIVPSNDMLIIESTHLLICHCIINAIRQKGNPKFNYDAKK